MDIDALVDNIVNREHKFPVSYLHRAIGDLDTAVWDLHAKLENRSVGQLFGATPGLILTYASPMKRDTTPDAPGWGFDIRPEWLPGRPAWATCKITGED